MSITKKHFKQLALAIAKSDNDFEQLVNNLINFCKSNNSNFNEKTFINAIDIGQITYDASKTIKVLQSKVKCYEQDIDKNNLDSFDKIDHLEKHLLADQE